MKISVEELKNLYYEKGMTLKEIAGQYQTSPGYLRKMMKRHKMKTLRGPSKYRKLIVQKSNIPITLDDTNIKKYVSNLSNKALEVILGALLGDSSVKIRQNSYDVSYNVSFGHSANQLEYLKYKYSLIEDLANPIRLEKTSKTEVIKDKLCERQDFYSFTTKPIDISYLHNLLYNNSKKTITKKYLEYLTPLSLSIWYMDDGSYSKDNRVIRLSTMCFNRKENEIIRDYFNSNLRMQCNIEKVNCGTGWSIILPQNATRKFLNIINPYKCECLNYKFPYDPSETLKAI